MAVSSTQVSNNLDQINDFLRSIVGQNAPQVEIEKKQMEKFLQFLLIGDSIDKVVFEPQPSQTLLAILLLDLIGIYGGDGKSDERLDPIIKQFFSWAESNQNNWKQSEWARIENLLKLMKEKQPSIAESL